MMNKRNAPNKGAHYDTVGAGLRRIMKEFNLTIAKVAQIIEVSDVKTVRDWKWGRTLPKGEYLIKLSDAFNELSIDYILGRIDYKQVANETISKHTGLSDKSIQVLNRMISEDYEIQSVKEINLKNVNFINYVLEHDYDWVYKGGNIPITTIFGKMEEYIYSDTATFEVSKYQSGNKSTLEDFGRYTLYARHHPRPEGGWLAFGNRDYRYSLHLPEIYSASILKEVLEKLEELKKTSYNEQK